MPPEPARSAADILQTGHIRLALFLPQYTKDAASGTLRGVGTGLIGIEIAHALAARLGVAVVLVEQPSPARTVECLKNDGCDIAFLGIEPSRATEVDFSPPLFQFDYTYLVPAGSSIQRIGDADRTGIRIAVVESHASALALRRLLKHADLVGTAIPDNGFDLVSAGAVDAFALPREQLVDYSNKLPGSRVLADGYGINRVAIAVRKGRSAWLAYLGEFVAEAATSNLVEGIIARGGLSGFEAAAP